MRTILATAFFAALTINASASASEPIVIKFSHVVAENTPKGLAAQRFKERVEQRLPGEVKVEVYPNALLIDDENVVAALQQQTVQIAAPSLSQLETYSKAYRVFDLPFLLQTTDAVQRFESGPEGRRLLSAMEPFGISGLCFLHNGMKQMSADKPLTLPKDASGLKFRIQSSSVLQAQFEALGATPVRAPFSKVFHLLETGTLNGQENTWSNIYSQRFYTVQPYITETNHGSLEYLLITSTAFWSGLADNVRHEIELAANDACTYGNSVAVEINASGRERVAASGYSKIITLTSDERRQWIDAMKPVWKEFEADIGRGTMDAALASN